MVINGAVRDAAALRAGALPVFAAGVTHRGSCKNDLSKISVPAAFDGMVAMPGYLVIGDGILCVPLDQVGAVHAAALARQAAEAVRMAGTLAGASDRGWVEASLRRFGCGIPA